MPSYSHKHEKVEFDFSWLRPKFELRWIICAFALTMSLLFEGAIWNSCSSNVAYHYSKDEKIARHSICTYEAELFRHRPEFAKQCEAAVREIDEAIMQSNKWKCFFSEQPLSVGKWELLILLAVGSYVSLRLYFDYRRRVEEHSTTTRESRYALEAMSSAAYSNINPQMLVNGRDRYHSKYLLKNYDRD